MRCKSRHVDAIIPRRGEGECRALRAQIGKGLNAEARVDREHERVILRQRAQRTELADIRPPVDSATLKNCVAKTGRDEQRDLNVAVEDCVYSISSAPAGPGGKLGAWGRTPPQLGADPSANAMQVGDPPVPHHVQCNGAIQPSFHKKRGGGGGGKRGGEEEEVFKKSREKRGKRAVGEREGKEKPGGGKRGVEIVGKEGVNKKKMGGGKKQKGRIYPAAGGTGRMHSNAFDV